MTLIRVYLVSYLPASLPPFPSHVATILWRHILFPRLDFNRVWRGAFHQDQSVNLAEFHEGLLRGQIVPTGGNHRHPDQLKNWGRGRRIAGHLQV